MNQFPDPVSQQEAGFVLFLAAGKILSFAGLLDCLDQSFEWPTEFPM